MSPAENKRAKRRKNKKIRSDPRNGNGAEAHPNIPLGCLNSRLENRALDETCESEPSELNNGSFREVRCLVCNSQPPEQPQPSTMRRGSADGCEDGKELIQESLKVTSQLPWYICANCKTSSESSLSANGFGDYLPLSFVADTEEIADSEICSCKSCFDQTYFSELTKKNSATCSLGLDSGVVVGGLPHIPPHLQREKLKDEEVHRGWQDLKMLLHQTYRESGLTLGEALTPHLPQQSQGPSVVSEHRIKEIVNSLCRQDAHKLYLCLQSQVKLFVVEMRLRLLMQVRGATPGASSNCSSPNSNNNSGATAKPFVCLMLEEYAKLCSAAAQMAPYLEDLEASHLKGFKLTWELVNRHLFQSIVYDDPLLHSRLTVNLPQHRVTNGNGSIGSTTRGKFHHVITQFDDEMTVLSVLWREAEQLIEVYNQGQAARAKQGLELLHAQMKQLMEEELNLSLFQRYPMECQKSCSHGGNVLKGHCPSGSSSSSPNFLSPSELVSLAEQADGYGTPLPPNVGSKEGNSGGGAWSPLCMKGVPPYTRISRHARFFPDLLESYQNAGQDCMTSDLVAAATEGSGLGLLPGSPPSPTLPPLNTALGDAVAGSGCCRLQQNSGSVRDLSSQLASPTKHNVEHGNGHQSLLQNAKNPSFKGGGPATFKEAGRHPTSHPSTTSNNNNNAGPDSKGGCECHSCNQQHHAHDHTAETHLPYEGSTKLRDLSPNLLTGLKSIFAEACGSPSALAAVKQLIHPHLYKVHNNGNGGGGGGSVNPPSVPQRDSKTSSPAPPPPRQNSSFFPEPFDLKLEMQGILREQIRLVTMGDWDYDVDEARSLFLHHFQNSVRPHRTSEPGPAPHFDLPAAPQLLPPLSPPPPANKFFSPLEDSHSVLRNSLPNPPGICQACKVEPSDGNSPSRAAVPGDGMSNVGVINNLGHVGRKMTCQQVREHGGLIPEGYGAVDCAAANSIYPQTSNLPATPPNSSSSAASSVMTTPATTPSSGGGLACSANGGNSGSSSSLSSMGTAERGVGSSHGCCESHVPDGGEESGLDDSCSERSSSTSTSNQRESRVCDCCYCEVFGHGVPVVAPVSRNYPEIRDRLRLRLSKRKAEGGGGGGGGGVALTNSDKNEPVEDSRAVEELLKYINGTEEEKNKQRKAKRKGPKRGDTASGDQLCQDRPTATEESLPDLLSQLQRISPLDHHQPTHHQRKQNSHPSPETVSNQQKAKNTVAESQALDPELPTALQASALLSAGNLVEAHKISRHQLQHHQGPRNNGKQNQGCPSQDHSGKGSDRIAARSQTSQTSRQRSTHPAVEQHRQQTPPPPQHQQQHRVTHLNSENSRSKKSAPGTEKIVNGNASLPEEGRHHFQHEKKTSTVHSKATPVFSDKGTAVSSQPPLVAGTRAEVARDSPKPDRKTVITNNNNNNNNNSGSSLELARHNNHHHHLHHNHMNGSISAKEIIAATNYMDVKSNVRSKKNKKKKNGTDDGTSPDDVFMPKDIDLENGELDEFEKELEAFKRFCFNSVPLANKEKVHVNLKDIVVKKKGNSNGVTLSNGHKF